MPGWRPRAERQRSSSAKYPDTSGELLSCFHTRVVDFSTFSFSELWKFAKKKCRVWRPSWLLLGRTNTQQLRYWYSFLRIRIQPKKFEYEFFFFLSTVPESVSLFRIRIRIPKAIEYRADPDTIIEKMIESLIILYAGKKITRIQPDPDRKTSGIKLLFP